MRAGHRVLEGKVALEELCLASQSRLMHSIAAAPAPRNNLRLYAQPAASVPGLLVWMYKLGYAIPHCAGLHRPQQYDSLAAT